MFTKRENDRNWLVLSFRWLGVSVLSLFELFEYFYGKIQGVWSKRKGKTKIDVHAFETKSLTITPTNPPPPRYITYPNAKNNINATMKTKTKY